MILSREDALELHGAIVGGVPAVRSQYSPELDALLSRLEAFIAGSAPPEPVEWPPREWSVKVSPYQPHERHS